MCGISVIINKKEKVDKSKILKMMDVMEHRGPDDKDFWIDKNVGFGFVRLSILDLSTNGRQPMFLNDRYIIVFNGEIYNYIELKKDLISKGYSFNSGTDTEVILAAYDHWGKDCIERFNGMWAFSIYDKLDNSFFISRDRFGIKPLYYSLSDDTLIFSSDIPSILAVSSNSHSINDSIMYDYLALNRTNHSHETFFKNIFRLLPGHNAIISNFNIEIEKWYDLESSVQNTVHNQNDIIPIFKTAINEQLRSDVPIGLCLSGGLDSSSIASMMLEEIKFDDFHTFSAVYDNSFEKNEEKYINLYKNNIKNMHFAHPNVESLIEDLDDFVTAIVEPVTTSSEYAEFKVMQLAQNHCTVLLNGQGVDEIFGGYKYIFGPYLIELMHQKKYFTFFKEWAKYYQVNKDFQAYKSFLFHLLSNKWKNTLIKKNRKYINSDFNERSKLSSELSNELYNANSLLQSSLKHFEHKFEHHLIWADKSGMWFSLETRFPYLDHRFVEYSLSLPADDKIKNGIPKYLFKKSMKKYLPKQIYNRTDKIGYETPEKNWFLNRKFKDLFNDIIITNNSPLSNYFNMNELTKIINMDELSEQNAQVLWKAISVGLWSEKFKT